MSTEFLDGLRPVDKRSPQFRLVRELMLIKGYDDLEPLGMDPDTEGTAMFYYHIPGSTGGVLEVSVHRDDAGIYHREVTDFITDRREIREMLGVDQEA